MPFWGNTGPWIGWNGCGRGATSGVSCAENSIARLQRRRNGRCRGRRAAVDRHWLLIDTDRLIDDLRDRPEAVTFLEGADQPLATTAVAVPELYVCVREG
jgi:hypothetical protein